MLYREAQASCGKLSDLFFHERTNGERREQAGAIEVQESAFQRKVAGQFACPVSAENQETSGGLLADNMTQ